MLSFEDGEIAGVGSFSYIDDVQTQFDHIGRQSFVFLCPGHYLMPENGYYGDYRYGSYSIDGSTLKMTPDLDQPPAYVDSRDGTTIHEVPPEPMISWEIGFHEGDILRLEGSIGEYRYRLIFKRDR